MRYDKLVLSLALLITISCSKGGNDDNTPIVEAKSPYITKVFEYLPAVGSYVNSSPYFEEGDNSESMCEKALKAIGGDNSNYITLGGYGGYVVVGFDTTIVNNEGVTDFKIKGNAFYNSTLSSSGFAGGSFEPGIVMVSKDVNGDGVPNDEWYEIEGSAHAGVQEEWFEWAESKGNDTSFIQGYEITYYRPEEVGDSVRWSDNRGDEGYVKKAQSASKSLFPLWVDEDKLTFKGSRLPQNGVNESVGTMQNYVLYGFKYGYADSATNDSTGCEIDIEWARDSNGNRVSLDGVDFVKIYNGVHQINGWLGECSTEVAGIEILQMR